MILLYAVGFYFCCLLFLVLLLFYLLFFLSLLFRWSVLMVCCIFCWIPSVFDSSFFLRVALGPHTSPHPHFHPCLCSGCKRCCVSFFWVLRVWCPWVGFLTCVMFSLASISASFFCLLSLVFSSLSFMSFSPWSVSLFLVASSSFSKSFFFLFQLLYQLFLFFHGFLILIVLCLEIVGHFLLFFVVILHFFYMFVQLCHVFGVSFLL